MTDKIFIHPSRVLCRVAARGSQRRLQTEVVTKVPLGPEFINRGMAVHTGQVDFQKCFANDLQSTLVFQSQKVWPATQDADENVCAGHHALQDLETVVLNILQFTA